MRRHCPLPYGESQILVITGANGKFLKSGLLVLYRDHKIHTLNMIFAKLVSLVRSYEISMLRKVVKTQLNVDEIRLKVVSYNFQ